MAPTFVDPMLQERFERDGFVVLPLLDDTEVDALRAAFDAGPDRGGAGFEPDFASPDRTLKTDADAAIREVLEPVAARTFTDHRIFFTSFLMKWADDASALPLHQDWSYVDEDEHVTVAMWCALDDADAARDNGPLIVLPGSHRLAPRLRGTNTPGWHEPYADVLEAQMASVPVRRGDVVVIDNRLLHGSPPNRSGEPRLAAAAAVAPTDAALRHVHVLDGKLAIYEVDDAFFLETSPIDLIVEGPPEHAPVSERRAYEPPAVEPGRVAEVCGIDPAPLVQTRQPEPQVEAEVEAEPELEAEPTTPSAHPTPAPSMLRRARRVAGRVKRKVRRMAAARS
jgi:hypothetical protein